MNRTPSLIIAGIVLLLTGTGMTGAADYKTPVNMTNDDRRQLMAGGNEYQQCVMGELRELASKVDDPRALTDAAMASCSDTLTAFAEEMAANNYDPDFSNYYIDKVKSRVANAAVRQALVFASQKQRMQDEPATGAESQGPQNSQ